MTETSTKKPSTIIRNNWLGIAKGVKASLDDHRTMLVAAGVAFYSLLALFPAITSLLAVGGLVMDPTRVVAQLDRLEGLMPGQVLEIIRTQASEVAASGAGGLGLAALVGLAVSIYSASKGIGSLIQGMNIAYDTQESRGFVSLTLIKVALTALIILGIVLGLVVTLVLPIVLSFLPGTSLVETAISGLGWIVLFALTIFGLALVYRIGPSHRTPQFKWVTPGALLAAVLWILGSAGFAFYVENFGSYNESFGALAGVIVMLMWLWLSALVVLLGAELNALTEERGTGSETDGGRSAEARTN